MVLTNAERQRRYRERLKAAAAAAHMSEDKAELLRQLRRRNAENAKLIEMLRSGALRTHEVREGGQTDTTHDAIARHEAMIAENERLLALYDPEGLTAFSVDG